MFSKLHVSTLPSIPTQTKKFILPVALYSIQFNKFPLTYDLTLYFLKIIKFWYPYGNLVTVSFPQFSSPSLWWPSCHRGQVWERGYGALVGKGWIWPLLIWVHSCSKIGETSKSEEFKLFSQKNLALALLRSVLEGLHCQLRLPWNLLLTICKKTFHFTSLFSEYQLTP